MSLSPLDPWIIDEIKRREEKKRREEERQPGLEIPRDREEIPPPDEGYHEPGQGIVREKPAEPSDRGVVEIEMPQNEPEEETEPFGTVVVNPELDYGKIEINPDTEGKIIEKGDNDKDASRNDRR
ncbi:MAG: hypothetical protein A2754_03975 [Candidatus Magasanikbacteria bacterium RIFCSPHIGHO2_01_FULL_47_8]|uniref:Uncharacterized protein n=1 Tax=Candidatus Magasanikbacteria bacterium RIFCSPHIGHO2_01_FULL_47_8 TaxID=1798673 RepID=A0A1F6MEK7_9BACT|nr:MAG: hypothetical protein A2754_03975 [Candidatus Magasanikbacteria bacterium RIFCSPHIGHO2_01_FULL_47_8]